jgi:hypothetical protein
MKSVHLLCTLTNTNFFNATEHLSFFSKKERKIKLVYKSLSWFKEKKLKNKQTEKPWKEIVKETKHFCQTWKKELKNKTDRHWKKNYTQRKIFHNMLYHGLRTPREEIAFTARPKIQSQSQIFRYGRSIFCLPHQPNFSDIFDLCLHCSVRPKPLFWFRSDTETET